MTEDAKQGYVYILTNPSFEGKVLEEMRMEMENKIENK